MPKYLIAFFMPAFLIGSCAPAPASLTPSATVTVIPTITPSPAPSATPTITPYPSLQPQGPYLLFAHDKKTLTMMDTDGRGRKQLQFPDDGYIGWDLNSSVSPDGKWIAYYTGSEREPYDLALHLLNLSNGTSQLISNLIAPGFPQNLEPAVETIYFTEHDAECSNDPKCRLRIIRSAFTESIGNALDWSPDGKLVAFAAQIDGPSSDLYIFNTENKSIRRITDELENIWSIAWSPDGDRILYLDSVPGTIYLSRYIRIADPNIQNTQHPKQIDGGPFWFEYGWIDQDSYLIYNGGEGAPPYRLRIINAETQEVKEIWKYAAESFFVDLKKQTIILSPYGRIYFEPEPAPGIYTVSFDGNYQKVSDEMIFFIEGQEAVTRYMAITPRNQLVGVKLDGSIISLSRKPDYDVPPHSSPDGKWIIITSETETELYSENLELRKALGIHATEIIWRPDSLGVFLSTDKSIYHLPIPDGELIPLHDCSPSQNCGPTDFIWLP
jgi:Tol biopolymer transport system component